jgi:hypothetical protein
VCHMKCVLRPESGRPGTLQASESHSEAIQVDISSPLIENRRLQKRATAVIRQSKASLTASSSVTSSRQDMATTHDWLPWHAFYQSQIWWHV